MKNQTEIPIPKTVNANYKSEFLGWLNRFSRFPRTMRRQLETLYFTEEELNKLRQQIEAKYKLKVEYLGRRRGA